MLLFLIYWEQSMNKHGWASLCGVNIFEIPFFIGGSNSLFRSISSYSLFLNGSFGFFFTLYFFSSLYSLNIYPLYSWHIFENYPCWFPENLDQFAFPPIEHKGSLSHTSSWAFLSFILLILAIMTRVNEISK